MVFGRFSGILHYCKYKKDKSVKELLLGSDQIKNFTFKSFLLGCYY